ncbi:MAG TPA: BTAD domain-containing putative transcriptional regulator [Gaiellaceae bacterium]|nr:BTAD domain-containing putative transcriptional regulator [Gaiellaceae bacterium]
MDFLLLGPLEVRDGDRVVPLPRKKHRALLALLLLRAGEVVSADQVVEELWGASPPKTALGALRNYVSQLRKTLGVDVIETRGRGYVAHVDADRLDAKRFERLTARARASDSTEACAAGLRTALDVWRGPALADLLYEPFAATEAARLDELRLAAREDLVDAELELGRRTDLIPEIEALVTEHPFRERLRGQLMLALYRAGRQGDALEAYGDARSTLIEELGLEPGSQLRELQRAILAQDPELDVPSVLPSVEERRKIVTVLCCELSPSEVGLDPERLRRETVRARAEACAAIEVHGGSVETRAGDELLGVFGVPTAHEDDALRAVRAAVEIRERLVGLRVGIDTGEVLAGRGFVSGEVVARAKRLQRNADPGEALLGQATHALCGRAVTVDGRGGASRLLDVDRGAQPIARRYAPLVGRRQELTTLRGAYDDARAEGRCRLITIVGEPGIGKTRLASELVDDLYGEALVLAGRCVSYGDGATWLPLREILDQAGERLDPIVEAAGSPGEVFLGVRRVFETLARARPLVIVVDDLHWAAPTLLDLVEYLAERTEAAVLCLCLARPELLDERPGWTGEVIGLDRLSDRQAEELAAGVDPNLRERVVEAAGGNPLFLEQLVAYANETGTLEGVPPTLGALIAARLDLLPADELDALQRASVIGRIFERPALYELGADLDLLRPLEKRGFLRPLRSRVAFHHVLVREVAYSSLSKEARAELHERLGDWLDAHGESDELVGHHLEQAASYRNDIGLAEGRTQRLAHDAGSRLGGAGIEAWKRGDTPAAVNLFGRAAGLLPESETSRLELLCELGPALRTSGDFKQAQQVLAEAVALAGDRPVEFRARLELAGVRLAADPGGSADQLLEIAAEALPVFEVVGDERAQARTWRWIAYAHGSIRGRWAASTEAAERALELYRRTGWSTSTCFADLAVALQLGPTPVPDAIAGCRELLREADLGGEAQVLCILGSLEAMAGRFADAQKLLARARSLFDQLGQEAVAAGMCSVHEARSHVLAGDVAAAAQTLLEACRILTRMGDRAVLADRATALADALLVLGRESEAERWSVLAEQTGAADDVWTQMGWRGVKAKLLARRGRIAQAEGLAREAAEMAGITDALNHQAKALLDLAEVLSLAGRTEEAREASEEAVVLYTHKGNTAGASHAASRVAELAPA